MRTSIIITLLSLTSPLASCTGVDTGAEPGDLEGVDMLGGEGLDVSPRTGVDVAPSLEDARDSVSEQPDVAISGVDTGSGPEVSTEPEAAFSDCSGFVSGCELPWIPDFQTLHVGASLPMSDTPMGEYRIGMLSPGASPEAIDWQDSTLTFSQVGPSVVVLSGTSSPCMNATIRRNVDVVDAYTGGALGPDSEAVSMDDARILGWADGVSRYIPGREVLPQYQNASLALGPAEGSALSAVTLGAGGEIIVSIEPPATNGLGPDFAVFENALNDTFLELAFVEVSSDGEHFARFPGIYLGSEPIAPFGHHEPELMAQLAGKYRAGFGVPFDLQVLSGHPMVQSGLLDLQFVTHVRVIDIVGDGKTLDSFGHPIFDPYPTLQSAGFELDAVAVLEHTSAEPCDD